MKDGRRWISIFSITRDTVTIDRSPGECIGLINSVTLKVRDVNESVTNCNAAMFMCVCMREGERENKRKSKSESDGKR